MPSEIDQYLHTDHLPHIWCAGCGNGTVLGAFVRVADELGLRKENTVVVGGIGCSSRAVGYVDFGTVHAIHGRALAFAAGIKMARPHFNVIVLTGDGDGAAIGGNHLIHACRRNLDITTILMNNQIYGMTGGQVSPLTEDRARGTTAPLGQMERAFDVCRLAEAAGATYVARGTAADPRQLQRLIRDGIRHRGFAFIEAMVQCPTEYGRRNPPAKPADMLEKIRVRAVPVAQAAKLAPEERAGKIITGVLFKDDTVVDFGTEYAALVAEAQRGNGD